MYSFFFFLRQLICGVNMGLLMKTVQFDLINILYICIAPHINININIYIWYDSSLMLYYLILIF